MIESLRQQLELAARRLVSTVPARRGWWSDVQTVQTARKVQLTGADILGMGGAGGRRRVVSVDDWGVPQLLSVQLDRIDTSRSSNCELRAIVNYGQSAVNEDKICDWSNGGRVSVVCTQVTVDVQAYQPDPDVAFDAAGFNSTLLVTIGEGGGETIPPVFSQTLPAIAPLASSALVIPPSFARGLSVMCADVTTPTADPYALFSLALFQVTTLIMLQPGPVLAGAGAVPVPQAAMAQILNTSATETIRPTLVWHLA